MTKGTKKQPNNAAVRKQICNVYYVFVFYTILDSTFLVVSSLRATTSTHTHHIQNIIMFSLLLFLLNFKWNEWMMFWMNEWKLIWIDENWIGNFKIQREGNAICGYADMVIHGDMAYSFIWILEDFDIRWIRWYCVGFV